MTQQNSDIATRDFDPWLESYVSEIRNESDASNALRQFIDDALEADGRTFDQTTVSADGTVDAGNDPSVTAAKKAYIKELKQRAPNVPETVTKTWKEHLGIIGAISGLLMGAKVGSTFGIATGGWGMPATIPCALVGALIGFLGGRQVGGTVDRDSSGAVKQLLGPSLIGLLGAAPDAKTLPGKSSPTEDNPAAK